MISLPTEPFFVEFQHVVGCCYLFACPDMFSTTILQYKHTERRMRQHFGPLSSCGFLGRRSYLSLTDTVLGRSFDQNRPRRRTVGLIWHHKYSNPGLAKYCLLQPDVAVGVNQFCIYNAMQAKCWVGIGSATHVLQILYFGSNSSWEKKRI